MRACGMCVCVISEGTVGEGEEAVEEDVDIRRTEGTEYTRRHDNKSSGVTA